MVIRDELYRLAKQLKFDVIDLRTPPVKDSLEKNLQKLIDRTITVDAVYLPLDSFLLTQAQVIGPKLRAAQIKSIAAQKKYILCNADEAMDECRALIRQSRQMVDGQNVCPGAIDIIGVEFHHRSGCKRLARAT